MSIKVERKPFSVRKVDVTVQSTVIRDTRKNDFGLDVKNAVKGPRWKLEKREEAFGYLVTMRNGTVIRVKDEAELRRLGLTGEGKEVSQGQFGEPDYDHQDEQMSLEAHAARLIKNNSYTRGAEERILEDIMVKATKPSNIGA